jgi:hypothetical protein
MLHGQAQREIRGTSRRGSRIPIEKIAVSVFRIPTDQPESDGTLEWNTTTLVLVEVSGGGEHGVGYTYADRPLPLRLFARHSPMW